MKLTAIGITKEERPSAGAAGLRAVQAERQPYRWP